MSDRSGPSRAGAFEGCGTIMTCRVCFDARIVRSWDTGVGRISVSLLRELPSVTSDLDIVILLDERAPPPPTRFGEHVIVRTVRMGSPSLNQHLRLPGWLREERVDAVFHLHPYSVPVWSPVPRIVSILDLYQLADPAAFPPGVGLYYRTVVGLVARRSAAVLTISEVSKAHIVRMLAVPPDRITVLPLAPDEAFRRIPPGPQRDGVLHRLGVEEPFVLYHGNQRPHKNLRRLVQAFALARRRFGLAHWLVITGKEEPGSRERDFTAVRIAVRAEGIDRFVMFPGYVTDGELAALYSAAGALFLPSLMEGFGLPVVEGFACGTPVVCGNRGALPEVAGDAAALVDPLDVEGMASVLGEVLTNQGAAKELSWRGSARSREFTWRRSAEAFCKVVSSVLNVAQPAIY